MQATVLQDAKDFFGQDSFERDWIMKNAELMQYIPRNVSGGIKAPTKKSSNEEWAGYYYAQIMEAESNTQNAEDDWKNLKTALALRVKEDGDFYTA